MADYSWIINAIFLLLMMISLPSTITTRPVPAAHKSDLISGNEFLSLFLNNYDMKKETKTKRFYDRNSESIDSFKYVEGAANSDNDENISAAPPSNFGMRQKAKKSPPTRVAGVTTTPKSRRVKTERSALDRPDSTQIVQLVTSGSKIVFLDEKPPSEVRPSAAAVRNVSQHGGDGVKVIAVSVSSSSDQQTTKRNYYLRNDKLNDVSPNSESSAEDTVYEDTASSDDETKSEFINHSRKSEFSIEETEPLTMAGRLLDSVNGESSNVHSIVAPPSASHNSHMRSAANHSLAHDKLMPFQTVIYHDNGHYTKEGSAQPRSVSYSSIAQNIDQLNAWKDSDRLLEAKKNVSESLRQPLAIPSFSQPEKVYSEPAKFYSEPAKVYGKPSKFYSEPAKVYSEPAKVYGQPERQYGEPSKVYSEPSKIYSEPAKIYSEPAKVYGEPSKVYWPRPAATTTTTTTTTTQRPPHRQRPTTKHPTTNSKRVIFNLDKLPYDLLNAPEDKSLFEPELGSTRSGQLLTPSSSVSVVREQHSQTHHYRHRQYTHSPESTLVTERPSVTESSVRHLYTPTPPEQNYEVEEAVSVMSNGRAHGVQQQTTMKTTTSKASTAAADGDDSKVGYVVEGRNFRKYRVEEKTSDGFIVGEYGVVSHNDGSLRGVRYTADSNINPNLIHEALMKFLSL